VPKITKLCQNLSKLWLKYSGLFFFRTWYSSYSSRGWIMISRLLRLFSARWPPAHSPTVSGGTKDFNNCTHTVHGVYTCHRQHFIYNICSQICMFYRRSIKLISGHDVGYINRHFSSIWYAILRRQNVTDVISNYWFPFFWRETDPISLYSTFCFCLLLVGETFFKKPKAPSFQTDRDEI